MSKLIQSIMIVDDDPNILETAKDILEEAGYAAKTAHTCSKALAALESEAVDLAIIDFNLPDGKGVDLAVRARAICPQLVIILMTGEAHVDLGPAKAVIHATLTKPVNPAQLIDIIQKIVEP
jgi:DNA-binding NtrC family response regulator